MIDTKVVVNSVVEPRGFFSYLTCLLPLLEQSEVDGIPVYVDWSGATNYLDIERGENVFDYYFEQPYIEIVPRGMEIVNRTEGKEFLSDFFSRRIYRFDPQVRAKSVRLIRKYIRVRPEILDIVDGFCEGMNGEKVLGVHIRSTDQFTNGHFSGQHLCLERYLELIDQAVFLDKYTKIYAASDSQEIIEWLKDNYPNLVTYDCTRSFDHTAIHSNEKFLGYRIGEEVLVESLILSRCQYFVASPSNVSTMVTFWNSELKFVEAMRGFLTYEPSL